MGSLITLLIIIVIVYLLVRRSRNRRKVSDSGYQLNDPAEGFGPAYRTGYLRELSAAAVEPIRRKDAQIRGGLVSKSTGGPPPPDEHKNLMSADFLAAMRYCAWRKGQNDAWIAAGLAQNPQWFMADLSQELLAGPRDDDMFQAVWIIKQINDAAMPGYYVSAAQATIVDPV